MALPLNFAGSSTPSKERSPITAPRNLAPSQSGPDGGSRSTTPVPDSRPAAPVLTTKPEDITSPHELTAFVSWASYHTFPI